MNAVFLALGAAWLVLRGLRWLSRPRPVLSPRPVLAATPAPGSTDDVFLAAVFASWSCEELARLSCEADGWSRRV